MPASPPLMPTMIFPSIASGAMVIEWPVPLSATLVFHRPAPVSASSASSTPSREPTNTRVVENRDAAIGRPESRSGAGPRASAGHDSRACRPLRGSSAVTVVGGSVTYIRPSATIGEVSTEPSPLTW